MCCFVFHSLDEMWVTQCVWKLWSSISLLQRFVCVCMDSDAVSCVILSKMFLFAKIETRDKSHVHKVLQATEEKKTKLQMIKSANNEFILNKIFPMILLLMLLLLFNRLWYVKTKRQPHTAQVHTIWLPLPYLCTVCIFAEMW